MALRHYNMSHEQKRKTLSPCPCCKKCKDCTDFKKVVDMKSTGLIIYRHTTRIENDKKKITNSPEPKTDDVFILHNTGDTEITSAKVFPSLEKRNINCQRCKSIIEHTQQLLKNVPKIEKNQIMGVCDYCQKKGEFGKLCTECNKIVKKFKISKGIYKDENKDYIKSWLAKSRDIDKAWPDENEGIDLKSRIHSDFTIDSFRTDCKSKPACLKSRESRTPSKMGIIPDSKHPYANSLKRHLERMPRQNLSELSLTWSSKRSSVSKDNDYDNINVKRIYKSAENPYNDKNIQQMRKHQFRHPSTREAGPGAKIMHDNLYFRHFDDSKMDGDRNLSYKPESKEIQLSTSLIKIYQADELSNAVTAVKEEYYYFFPKTKLPDKYINTKRQLASSAELIKETQNMIKERESARKEKKEKVRLKKKQRKLSNKYDQKDKRAFDYKDKTTFDLKGKTAAKEGNKIIGEKENKEHTRTVDSKTKDYPKDVGDKKSKSANDKTTKAQKSNANQDAEKQKKEREEQLRKEKEDKERLKKEKEEESKRIKEEKENLKKEKEEESKRIKEEKEKLKNEKEEQLRREKEEKERQKKEMGDGKKGGDNVDKAMLDKLKKGKEEKANKERGDANNDMAKKKQEEDLFRQIQKRLEEEKKQPMTADDHLLKIKEGPKTAPTNVSRLSQMNLTPMLYIKHRCAHKHNRNSTCAICQDSDLEIDVDSMITKKQPEDVSEIIIGQRIIKCKSRKRTKKSKYCVPENVYKHEFVENDPLMNVTEENVLSASPETRATKSAR